MKDDAKAYKYAQPDSTIELSDGTKVRLYDLGEVSGDRYTAVLDGPAWGVGHNGFLPCLGFNEVPWSPNMGVSMFSDCQEGSHLGKRIQWSELPEKLQMHVLSRTAPRGVKDLEKQEANQTAVAVDETAQVPAAADIPAEQA